MRRQSTENWKRNLYTISFAELVAISGFSIILPFLPYYLQELGVTDLSEVAIWSGLVLTSSAVTMALFAPLWGSLADRYGRRLMVQRAMFGGALVMAAMAFVQNVPQLVLLRAIQGSLTGTVAAATTLVASTVPRQRYGYAMGLLQTAVYSGVSVGPILGGALADTVGLRSSFLMTGALLAMAGLTVHLFVHEDVKPKGEDHGGTKGFLRQQLKIVLRSRALVSALGIRITVRTGARMLSPILPLFVQSLIPGGRNVATTAGLIMGVSGVGSTLGALGLGRISDRVGFRLVLILSTLGAAAIYFPQSFVTEAWQLFILQAGTGVALGGTITTLSAVLANLAPEEAPGVVFGVDSSVIALANAVAPLAGAAVAARLGLRSVFLCTGVVLTLAGLGVMKLVPQAGNKI